MIIYFASAITRVSKHEQISNFHSNQDPNNNAVAIKASPERIHLNTEASYSRTLFPTFPIAKLPTCQE